MSSAVEIRNVQKWYGGVQAVREVSIQVEQEQCFCLLGPSGCGKTTTLRMIAGLEKPDAGSIFIGGVDVTHLPPYERNIGVVFQDYALFPHMTVEENIRFGLHHRGVAANAMPDRIAEVLQLVKLSGLEKRKPAQLSGGQQQRVALARALATRPAVLLLDEPLSNLDAKLRDELRVQMREILRAAHTTTIMVTHDQEEAMALADRMVVMNQGIVEQEGEPMDIYDHPRSKFVADFFGRSNWFATEVIAIRNGVALLDGVYTTGWRVHAHEGITGGAHELSIRPERLQFLPTGTSAPHLENRLHGKLRHVEHRGGHVVMHVTLSNGMTVHALASRQAGMPEPGDAVELGFSAADARLMPTARAAKSAAVAMASA